MNLQMKAMHLNIKVLLLAKTKKVMKKVRNNMTPEREKYLESITEREKALKQEIRNQKRVLYNLKFRLSHSVNQTANEVYKEHIKHRKYIICALKHELERVTSVTMQYFKVCNATDACWRCSYCGNVRCHEIDYVPIHCPECGRKIKTWKF